MALAAALGGATGPLSADAGRAALLALIRLHELGALRFNSDAELAHRCRPLDEPAAVGGCDPVPVEGPETGHAYNMASLFTSQGESQ